MNLYRFLNILTLSLIIMFLSLNGIVHAVSPKTVTDNINILESSNLYDQIKELTNNDLSCFISDENNGIWVGTESGILVHMHSDGSSETFDSRNFVLTDEYASVKRLVSDGSAGVWIAIESDREYKNIVHLKSNGSWNLFDKNSLDQTFYCYITSLISDGKGGVWVGLSGYYLSMTHSRIGGALIHLDNDGNREVFDAYNSDLPDNSVTTLLADGKGGIWIGTIGSPALYAPDHLPGGLVHMEADGSCSVFDKDNSELPANHIEDIFSDGNGGIWIQTEDYNLSNFKKDGSWSSQTVNTYQSTYDLIQWDLREDDSFYCIDIFDSNWNILHQAIKCGYRCRCSPKEFNLSPGVYHWKVWSESVIDYNSFQEGFEGEFTVPESCNGLAYFSTHEQIQWGCRENDCYYCVDIFDESWNMIYQAVSCGNIHSYSPTKLNLSPGLYHWKVWSESMIDYSSFQEGFEGEFTVPEPYNGLPYFSSYGQIQWGVRENDYYYCVDIFDESWNMIYQAVSCGNIHSYSPTKLNLSPGLYHWKIWSPSGYGESGFEGEFAVP